MDYLVVAPHTPFFQWQVALLAQSFRLQGKEENLAIMLVAGNEPPVQSPDCNSFLGHPRLRAVRLAADAEPDLVRLHGLAYAVRTGLVSQPFTLVPPHSILHHPVAAPQANVTFNYQPDFLRANLDHFGISGVAMQRRIQDSQRWLPVGEVYVFNGLMMEFYERLLRRAEIIAFDSYRELLKDDKSLVLRGLLRAAMSLTLMEVFPNIQVDTSQYLECRMQDNRPANFINYYYGSPPTFSLMHYAQNSVFAFCDHPFNGVMQTVDTKSSMYMKHVASTLTL